MMPLLLTLTAVLGATLAGRADSAPPQGPPPEERIAALKQSLQENQKQLRQYEWIETTIISLKGEEKSRKQQRCYHGTDGKIQKVPVGDTAPPAQESGRRRGGRIKQAVVENKKEDLQEYMQQAVALVHQYVPPQPEDIDKAKKAGAIAAKPLPAGHLRLEFTNHLKPGDNMAIDLDLASNRLLGVTVASYLDTPDDAVTLGVEFAALPAGANYAAQTTLDAPAKKVRVVVQNSGHRPVAR